MPHQRRTARCARVMHWIGCLGVAAWCLALPSIVAADEFDPVAIFLTWQRDPTTTMTIDWHTVPDDGNRPTRVQYRPLGSQNWHDAQGKSHPFPHSDRTIHRVEITELEPGSEYQFRFGEDSKAYRFRTMPADNQKPVRFVTGGDLSVGKSFEKANRLAMQYKPDFILWGGDLAYVNSMPYAVGRWHNWFTGIKNTLIDEEGRVTPIVCAIGNHETFTRSYLANYYRRAAEGSKSALAALPNARKGMSEDEQKEALKKYMAERGLENGGVTYFYDLFAFPGRPGAYNVLDFGNYLSLVVLNTNHGPGGRVTGDQRDWLKKTLAERKGRFTNIMLIYHVPAFPSARSYTGSTSASVRENWVPLFEQAGVRVAFENHDHSYKRTVPIRQEAEHPDGIVYLGDGAWGVSPREPHSVEKTWYLAHSAHARYVMVVTLQGDTQDYRAIGEDGEIIDHYAPTATPKAAPALAP